MTFKTVQVENRSDGLIVTLNRPFQNNSINGDLLLELNHVLDLAERDDACRLLVIEGQRGVFCTGLDFEAFASSYANAGSIPEIEQASQFAETLKRISKTEKIIVCKVDGLVMAGGVGLIAASDLVVATPCSKFSLSETLWGLLPAMVIPYLIRRVGYHNAYRMTLTTLPVTAKRGGEIGLVDEVSETPDDSIERLWCRLKCVESNTVKRVKRYFHRMYMITPEMEKMAVEETVNLLKSEEVSEKIRNFIEYQRLPWEDSS